MAKNTSPKLSFEKLTLWLATIRSHPPKQIAWVLLILGLLIILYLNKNLFIAALVNNQPITTQELNTQMKKLYKERILNQMINEKILDQEARKKGVSVSPAEINEKIAEVEKSYGGKESFLMLLSQQGISEEEFTSQTKVRLLVEKLYSKEAQPSEDEIKKYVEANKDNPEATDAAKFRQSAQEILKQQKLGQIFTQKFQELKQKAKIQIF